MALDRIEDEGKQFGLLIGLVADDHDGQAAQSATWKSYGSRFAALVAGKSASGEAEGSLARQEMFVDLVPQLAGLAQKWRGEIVARGAWD